MNQSIALSLDTKQVALFKVYQVLKPKAPKSNATDLVFGKVYRRIYQDKGGLYAVYNGKRQAVYLINQEVKA